ncbi:phosphosulfolactate synthase [Bacteroidota bacterium]
MNLELPYIPERPVKPRETGVTMVMDKGLSLREAENFTEKSGQYVDFLKLGFGTSAIMKDVEKKIKVYQEGNMKVYVGGTLFEAYIVRNMFDDYLRLIDNLKLDAVEVSDGSILMDHDAKCEYISMLSKNHTVLSEVGSKEAGIITAPKKWIQMMLAELEAGSFKVIAEARESGTVGIFRPNGVAHVALVNKILAKVSKDKIIWETPLKSQQVWFIKNLGANVNLGNIGPGEVISLETLRLGLRGDTFFTFLPEEFQKKKLRPSPNKKFFKKP